MEILYENLLDLTWQQMVMWAIGGLLIYLAIAKDMEPTLLLPIGFGAIMVNLPNSGAVTQIIDGVAEHGALSVLFEAGIANELFPPDPLYRHWRHDRLWPAADQPQADDFRRGSPVRHLLYPVPGLRVL